MYTRLGLEKLRQQVAERRDDNAMRSACGEYNCDCHDLVPKLLDDLEVLHDRLAEIKRAVGNLPIGE